MPKKEQLKFKSPAEYRYIGKNVPIADLDDILAGHAVFGMDARDARHGLRVHRTPAGVRRKAQEL